MWVVATKDYRYDDSLYVRNGQVFRLRGHPNDGLLLKHRLVKALEPQPEEKEVGRLPTCAICGAHFQDEWQRERCGKLHEEPESAERALQRVAPGSLAGRRMRRTRNAARP